VQVFTELFNRFPAVRWSISFPPAYFHPEIFDGQASALLDLGANVVVETNSTIGVSPSRHDSPMEGFSRGNRKRVRAFTDLGGLVRRAAESELNAAFDLLKANRERRGVQLSIDREKFLKLATTQPNLYRCWLAIADSQLMGAALTVELDEKSTYVLYWGDSLRGREVSVSASICLYLLVTVASEGKAFLDLGISSNAGQVDEGLLRFKSNLGAETYSQFRFSLSSFD
jgi:hypothetical protein